MGAPANRHIPFAMCVCLRADLICTTFITNSLTLAIASSFGATHTTTQTYVAEVERDGPVHQCDQQKRERHAGVEPGSIHNGNGHGAQQWHDVERQLWPHPENQSCAPAATAADLPAAQ